MIMTRDERQDATVKKIVDVNCCGTVEATTAYGKTRVAQKIINLLRRKDNTRAVIVVVPTLQLKSQWEQILTDSKQINNTEVFVINGLANSRMRRRCSLLVLDEIHRYAADTFSRVFEVVSYDFILGLTATMKRMDGKHGILQSKAPIIDRITTAEAKKNGWISAYREYNLGVSMSDEEKENYASLRSQFQAMFDKFNNDFTVMKNCSFNAKPVFYEATNSYSTPAVVRRAMSLGWHGNSARQAYTIMSDNESRPRGQKVNIWGGELNHPYHPDKLHGFALNGMRVMRLMKEFVYKAPSKLIAAKALIDHFKYKTITFGELTETAEDLREMIGPNAVVYHSAVKAKVIDGVRVAGAKLKRDAIHKVKTDSEINVICTAKALDQGFDFPEAEMGLILSRTSNPTQQIQRRGRVIRKHTFADGTEKEGIIVNIYLKDTKDFNWLKSAQKEVNSIGVAWVDSVEEIIETESELKEPAVV